MNNRELEDIGDRIQDLIEDAVKSKNYEELSRNVAQTVNRAVESGSDALKNALNGAFNPEHNARAYETHKKHGYQEPPFGKGQNIVYDRRRPGRERTARREQEQLPALYGSVSGPKVKSILKTVFGGILTGSMGISLITLLVFSGFGIGSAFSFGTVFMGAGTVVGAALLSSGCSGLGQVGRFQKYLKTLGQKTYCNLEQLSRVAGKPIKFVKKDLKGMIEKGWFLEGHMDRQETCLITSHETYQQYMETQRQLEMKKKEEDRRKEEDQKRSPQVQEVLDKGEAFITEIHRCNEAIPGKEISDKISRIELIVQKIFERAEEHPEIIPDLKRLMDYYLPMTVKLLNAYEDMDGQPVQGENIQTSKQEIEKTLDTLNKAFEKLLDSVFRDTTMDVSSDISVLHTLLAQEGLTESDFEKMKENTLNL